MRWPTEEIEYLKQIAPARTLPEILEELFQKFHKVRTADQLRTKLSYIDVSYIRLPRGGGWQVKEVRKLRRIHGIRTTKELSEIFDRNISAVYRKCSHLGIQAKPGRGKDRKLLDNRISKFFDKNELEDLAWLKTEQRRYQKNGYKAWIEEDDRGRKALYSNRDIRGLR